MRLDTRVVLTLTTSIFDKMNVDLRLQEDFNANVRKRKARGRSKRGRKKIADDDGENGFHFVAYTPACGRVWRMDGLERNAHSLGTLSYLSGRQFRLIRAGCYDSVHDWLPVVFSDIQTQLEAEAVNQMEFSLLRLVSNPETATRNPFEHQMRRYREDWGPFISHLLRFHAEKGDLEERMG